MTSVETYNVRACCLRRSHHRTSVANAQWYQTYYAPSAYQTYYAPAYSIVLRADVSVVLCPDDGLLRSNDSYYAPSAPDLLRSGGDIPTYYAPTGRLAAAGIRGIGWIAHGPLGSAVEHYVADYPVTYAAAYPATYGYSAGYAPAVSGCSTCSSYSAGYAPAPCSTCGVQQVTLQPACSSCSSMQHVQLVQRLRRGDGEPNGLRFIAGDARTAACRSR